MTQYNVGFDVTQPSQLVFSAAVKPGGRQVAEQTIYNRDPNIQLLIALDEPHQTPDFTGPRVSIVDPLSSTVVNGTVDVWGVGNPGTTGPPGSQTTIVVDVIGTALGTSGNPVAIGTALVASGLAVQIAAQIADQGISLVPSPSLLYSVGLASNPGLAALVGLTVPNMALGAGCYDAGLTQQAADTAAVSVVARPAGGQHPTVTKKFWNLSDWKTTKNSVTGAGSYASLGTKVVFCMKPVVTSGLALGSDFTTTGTTAQKNAAIADKASLASFLATMTGAGYTAANSEWVMWQEPGNSQNLGAAGATQGPIDYNNMMRTYGPTVTAAGFTLTLNVNFTGAISRATDYANAGLGLRAYGGAGAVGLPTVTSVAMDWYTNNYFLNNFLDTPDANGDSIVSIAVNNGLIFSLNEWGCNPGTGPGQFSPSQCNQYMTLDATNSVLAVMSRLQNQGHPIGNLIYYEGQCDASGAGDITSPMLSPSDFRVAGYQKIFDSLTASTLTGTTINANSTKTIAPLVPSPVGAFANTDALSYELVVGLMAGAASTNPFATIIMTFFDFDVTGPAQVQTDVVKFTMPLGTNGDPNGPTVFSLHGPLRGAFMNLKINNVDTVAATLEYLQFASTGRNEDRHVGRWDCNAGTSPGVPGFTLASAGSASLQIGREETQTVAAGATKAFLNGLWAGQAFLRVLISGATGPNVQFQLQPQPTSLFGTTNLVNETLGLAGGVNDELLVTIALPRTPLKAIINNNEATATITASYQLIAIET